MSPRWDVGLDKLRAWTADLSSACGKTCGALQACVAGESCAAGMPTTTGIVYQCTSCPDGLSGCGDSCVDETSDSFNCGACGHICPQGVRGVTGNQQYCCQGRCISTLAVCGDP